MDRARRFAQGLVAGFGSDLPGGYQVRLSHATEEEVRLEVSSDGGAWTDIARAMVDNTEGLVWMLRSAQGELIEHEFGHAWPRCPVHGSHPLRPEADGWHCPIAGPTSADGPWAYGSLSGLPVAPEPDRADGEVRWYLDDLGWGVIAHHSGDLFVLFASIETDGYRALREGERVDFDIAHGQQGRFGRAEHVRPLPG